CRYCCCCRPWRSWVKPGCHKRRTVTISMPTRRPTMAELLPLLLFALVCLVLMLGFPVAFTLGGVSLLFALLGWLTGTFDPAFLHAMPNRLYGIMTNQILIAVPLFVFMGVMLEKSRIAGRLLQNMGLLFGPLRSEEHTSELQSRENVICRLLLE